MSAARAHHQSASIKLCMRAYANNRCMRTKKAGRPGAPPSTAVVVIKLLVATVTVAVVVYLVMYHALVVVVVPVSYTHSTLPPNREVYISVVAGSLKKKYSYS